ncbi:MAG: RING finger protein, partial [Promethearchaeia archaeon]
MGLALRLQMVEMIKNDLDYMHPDDNGVKVCQMAFRQLSYRAVKLADALEIEEVESAGCGMGKRRIDPCSICLEDMQGEDDTQVVSLACSHTFHRRCLDELVNSGSRTCPLCRTDLDGAGSVEEMVDKVRNLVQDCESELLHTLDEQQPLPAALDLEQREACWVGNALAYDVEAADADPGQVVPLQKFVPMDLLAVPERISTRSQAVCALRVCDRLCTLLDNQHHNVKNTKHLILSLLEHVFIKVVPVPKPRKDPRADDAEASHIAERSQRRRQKEDAKKREIAAKRDEMRQAKGKKTPKKSSEDAAEAIAAERAEEQARRSLEKVETSQGLEKETMICSQSCIWDAEITYELQVEMMLVLQRLMEHFASAVLSMQASRPLDALRVVVPGCICALSDAIIRRRAIDNPSVACSLLMGLDVNGRQLGVQGFGIGVGLFASQTETIEVHTPE